jgi:hypothetical protein
MKRISWLCMLIAFIGLVPSISQAANKYVRVSASGSNNGTDWTNAYTSLPAVLVRGDTYYVASGSYAAYTFDDPQSGTLTITVKKATATDHGTDVGWQAAFGTSQAIFNSVIKFQTGYYVLDGQTRNEADWFDGPSYGFRINNNNMDQNIVISGGSASSNIAVKYVFVDAIYKNLPTSTTLRRYSIDTDTYGGTIATNLLFHRMYVYGGNNVWFLRTTNGAIVEYSASNGVDGNAANHGEIVNLYYSGNNAVIRYNQWKNAFTSGGGTALVAITYADGLQFYGNVVANFMVGDGVVGFNGYYSSHNRVYNNTIIDGLGACGTPWGSGTDNLVYNNLFINCRTVNIEGTNDYNGFSDSNGHGEAHAQVNIPTSIFANYSGGNFKLATETRAGMLLGPPFNKDLLGNTRGADGTTSLGAFEFSANSGSNLSPPKNLVIR